MHDAQHIDCRGQQCPQPILTTAKAARALRGQGGGIIEISADDEAFPLDIRSWCRSSGTELVEVSSEEGTHRAIVRIPGNAPAQPRKTLPTLPASGSAEPYAQGNTVVDADVDVDVDVSLSNLDESGKLARLNAIGSSLSPGERVRIRCRGNEFATPLLRWASDAGHEVLSFDARTNTRMELRAATVSGIEAAPSNGLQVVQTENRCTLLVLHNDKEALLAALLVANGAAAQGMDVVLFFTFWGLNLLRGEEPNEAQPKERVSWMQRMMKWMMPKGPRRQKLGQMDMGGMGRGMLASIMKRHDIMDIPELMDAAEELGARFVACTMSMQVMGITKRDLAPRENLEYGGVASFVESAGKSNLSLMF